MQGTSTGAIFGPIRKQKINHKCQNKKMLNLDTKCPGIFGGGWDLKSQAKELAPYLDRGED